MLVEVVVLRDLRREEEVRHQKVAVIPVQAFPLVEALRFLLRLRVLFL